MFPYVIVASVSSVIAAHEAAKHGIVLPKLAPPPKREECDSMLVAAIAFIFGVSIG